MKIKFSVLSGDRYFLELSSLELLAEMAEQGDLKSLEFVHDPSIEVPDEYQNLTQAELSQKMYEAVNINDKAHFFRELLDNEYIEFVYPAENTHDGFCVSYTIDEIMRSDSSYSLSPF